MDSRTVNHENKRTGRHEIDLSQLKSDAQIVSVISRRAISISNYSLLIGFFVTMAIPRISRRLYNTKEIESNAAARFERTLNIIQQIILQGYDSPFGKQMLALMNQRHRPYDIPNEEYLYVLSIYSVMSLEWAQLLVQKYPRLDVAWYNVWREIGLRMGIDGIPENIAGMKAFQLEFEKENLYFSPENKILFQLLLKSHLKKQDLKGKIVTFAHLYALLDEKYRVALGLWRMPGWVILIARRYLRFELASSYSHLEAKF